MKKLILILIFLLIASFASGITNREIRRIETGLIYEEDFDNTDPWTLGWGNDNLTISGGKLRLTGGSHFLEGLAQRAEGFIQSRQTHFQPWGRPRIYLRSTCAGGVLDNSSVFWGSYQRGAEYDTQSDYKDTVRTGLFNILCANRSVQTYYDWSMWVDTDGHYKFWHDGALRYTEADYGAAPTWQGNGYAGLGTNGTSYTYFSKYLYMTDYRIYMNNLPPGWKATVDTVTATESDGTATLDVAALDLPKSSIIVKNASNTVMATYTGSVYGGDIFEYTYKPTVMFVNYNQNW